MYIIFFQERLDCSELINLERYLEYWSAEGAKQFPQRSVKTLVIHCSGKTVCVTRFFRPLPLPCKFVHIRNFTSNLLFLLFWLVISEEVLNTSPEMVSRFVSLIPVVNSNVSLIGRFDVWLTGDVHILLLIFYQSTNNIYSSLKHLTLIFSNFWDCCLAVVRASIMVFYFAVTLWS